MKHTSSTIYFQVSSIFLLLILTVLVSISVGTNFSKEKNLNASILSDKSMNLNQKGDKTVANPFFYTEYKNTPAVMMYNSETKSSDKILDGYLLYASPKIGYDGRIFVVKSKGDSDSPYINVQELNVSTKSLTDANIQEPFNAEAMELSPDGVHVLALYDNLPTIDPKEIPAKSVVAWNLLTGEYKILGSVSATEYLAEFHGENIFTGATGFNVTWENLNCVRVSVYKDDPDASNVDKKKFVEKREFCLE